MGSVSAFFAGLRRNRAGRPPAAQHKGLKAPLPPNGTRARSAAVPTSWGGSLPGRAPCDLTFALSHLLAPNADATSPTPRHASEWSPRRRRPSVPGRDLGLHAPARFAARCSAVSSLPNAQPALESMKAHLLSNSAFPWRAEW